MGGGTPDTESVQRHILTLLSGRDTLSSTELPELLNLPIGAASAEGQIHQAAQILVNTGRVRAVQNGRAIDPVNAEGPYHLSLPKYE